MLAASWGVKLADAVRRVLMYTKASDDRKAFYAFARGAFPVRELCGVLTALQWARRDVLGRDIGLAAMLGPAVFIHGMANFRGMKPVFKWNSSKPWAEMQLSPSFLRPGGGGGGGGGGLADGSSTTATGLNKAFASLVWASILARVAGYCVKNYYLINRQAVKRITRYAGNDGAFEAELITGRALKRKEKN